MAIKPTLSSPCFPPTKTRVPLNVSHQKQAKIIKMSPSLHSPPSNPRYTTITTPSSAVTILSKATILPDKKSNGDLLKLSVSDLPMLSCHYIQKGLFFPPPPIPIRSLLPLLTHSLSRALSAFPALTGRLYTDSDGHIFISCTDTGVDFSFAVAPSLTLPILLPPSSDVPLQVKSLFSLDGAVSFDGHFLPIAAFQLTELGDGSIFLACSVSHAVVDGTSLWNFFNAWAELSRSPAIAALSRPPDFRRNFFLESSAVLRFPGGIPPIVTFPVDAPLRERIFHFTSKTIRELKYKANRRTQISEISGKSILSRKQDNEISSFQSLCAMLWRSVTRARKHLAATEPTTFRMAVNCRKRVVPAVDERYFGNAIQSIPTTAAVGEVEKRELWWTARLLHRSVVAHDDATIKRGVAEWEAAPRCFPLGNPNGAGITMGSSPRFPMYEGNDFGWGGPVAVRSGRANKFDGKISAFPGRDGEGSVDLEVCLEPATMAALLEDNEFMSYVSETTVKAIEAI